MAKVTMPLMSASASGKLGDSIVYFGWKGTDCVRGYVVPANPKSASQGDQRLIIGGVGRAVAQLQPSSTLHQYLIDEGLIPAGQTKQSYLVKRILANQLSDATEYGSVQSAFEGLTENAAWDSEAASQDVNDFDLTYADVSPFEGGMMLYVLAKAFEAMGYTTAPFDTAVDDWTSTEITAFIAAIS